MKFRKLLSLGLAALTMLSMSISASATGIVCNDSKIGTVEKIDDVNFVLVSDEETVLENGQVAEVKTFIEDGAEMYASTSGQHRYRCEARFYNTIDQVMVKVWVVGMFHWNSETDRAYVESADSDYDIVNPYFEYVSEEHKHGSDQGGLLWGEKYAYVEQSVTYLDNRGTKRTSYLKFDVNVNGKTHWNTKLETNDVSVT